MKFSALLITVAMLGLNSCETGFMGGGAGVGGKSSNSNKNGGTGGNSTSGGGTATAGTASGGTNDGLNGGSSGTANGGLIDGGDATITKTGPLQFIWLRNDKRDVTYTLIRQDGKRFPVHATGKTGNITIPDACSLGPKGTFIVIESTSQGSILSTGQPNCYLKGHFNANKVAFTFEKNDCTDTWRGPGTNHDDFVATMECGSPIEIAGVPEDARVAFNINEIVND